MGQGQGVDVQVLPWACAGKYVFQVPILHALDMLSRWFKQHLHRDQLRSRQNSYRMPFWSKTRLEGRALEHGLVAWLRSQRQGTTICRPRAIRMLRLDDSVDLVNDPWILDTVKWHACKLVESLRKVADFTVFFAEQTVHDGRPFMMAISVPWWQDRLPT